MPLRPSRRRNWELRSVTSRLKRKIRHLRKSDTRAHHQPNLLPRSAKTKWQSWSILPVAQITLCKLLQTPGAGLHQLNHWRHTSCKRGATSTGATVPLRNSPRGSLRRVFLTATNNLTEAEIIERAKHGEDAMFE